VASAISTPRIQRSKLFADVAGTFERQSGNGEEKRKRSEKGQQEQQEQQRRPPPQEEAGETRKTYLMFTSEFSR